MLVRGCDATIAAAISFLGKTKEGQTMTRSPQRLFAQVLALVMIAVMALTLALTPPAGAETSGQRSTRNIILAGVALATAVILYNNYHHKQVAHDTVVGRTADGGVVYADGRIVYPDGTVVYTSNDGRQPCSYDGSGVPCGAGVRAYRVANRYDADDRYTYDADRDHDASRPHGHGHHYGWANHDNEDDGG
jgi:hypothetical protein